ncbi:PTS sugar transporter subunit IIA [Paenalcaligenes niemegkensis]|uniref:PTS sugar transporter subunit IIA n=1 Tax=Paenalcaligenes niemegkensis TaxID=2895469 RepID=UPI001EE88626|nr:PTS sugar transporter subunit IIA [Paenalcaligenes niemegkensis]MCQ9616473.1 PTS sugar transporter subunit IIA [Paenalcaligenes niemegkensis]
MPSSTEFPRIVLVMHAPLGSALAACVRHVYGDTSQLEVIDVGPADISEIHVQRVYELICADAQSTLLLCDLMGATPFNIAHAAMQRARSDGAKVNLISGANLGMVLKAVADRHTDPRDFVEAVRDGALRGIVIIEEHH